MSLRNWEYGDDRIGQKEIVFTMTSLIIGVGILTLPRAVAKATNSSDGWISILLAGAATLLLAWLAAKLATKFHNRTFLEFVSDVTGRPVAFGVALFYFLYYLTFSAYISRSVAELAKQFLFERTPIEIISLSYMLVVIYAVSGSRTGLVRLAVMFVPFVMVITGLFLLLGINLFQFNKLLPFFSASWGEILNGSKESVFSFLGFEAVLFYAGLMRKPEKAPKLSMIAVLIAVVTYIFVYIFSIGIFSYEVTQNIMYPTLELAREVSVPGEFFERLESLFLIFWLVSTFATTSIALDMSVQSIHHVVKVKKKTMLYVMAPSIYLVSMVPQNIVQLSNLGTIVSYLGLLGAIAIPLFLYAVAKIREVRVHE
ncbi:endospore germination permease [Paenibacillus sp. LHD-117]|uniref:GerAB/ArcD/ProY family transporter n=1 Tax=Paenibacillus sp. LHD-117 TaxID=3071412 RepID=UPI0027DF3E08|nr:endospore germination permease [Paenibacillus sp. LHD-117]MDQ6418138.1 endospore germination permease [Paenibacillus sp. LHD-117]